jgi:hypothetical protein
MYQVTCLVPVWVKNSSLLRVNEFLTVRPVRYPVAAGWHQAGIMTHLWHSAAVVRSIAIVAAVGSAAAASVAFVVMVWVVAGDGGGFSFETPNTFDPRPTRLLAELQVPCRGPEHVPSLARAAKFSDGTLAPTRSSMIVLSCPVTRKPSASSRSLGHRHLCKVISSRW